MYPGSSTPTSAGGCIPIVFPYRQLAPVFCLVIGKEGRCARGKGRRWLGFGNNRSYQDNQPPTTNRRIDPKLGCCVAFSEGERERVVISSLAEFSLSLSVLAFE